MLRSTIVIWTILVLQLNFISIYYRLYNYRCHKIPKLKIIVVSISVRKMDSRPGKKSPVAARWFDQCAGFRQFVFTALYLERHGARKKTPNIAWLYLWLTNFSLWVICLKQILHSVHYTTNNNIRCKFTRVFYFQTLWTQFALCFVLCGCGLLVVAIFHIRQSYFPCTGVSKPQHITVTS